MHIEVVDNTSMNPDHFPEAASALLERSDVWVYEQTAIAMRDTIDSIALGAYFKVYSIFQEQRRATAERIEAAGGVDSVHSARYSVLDGYSTGSNYVKLRNGSSIFLSELVTLEPITVPIPSPNGALAGTERQHSFQFKLGGPLLTRSKAENPDPVDVRDVKNKWFEQFMEDPSFVPEDSAIIESVTTHLPNRAAPHVVEQAYSLSASVRRAQTNWEDDLQYWSDPSSYRRRALFAGDAKLRVSFTAPIETNRKGPWDTAPRLRTEMKTIITNGRIETTDSTANVQDVVTVFNRYLGILDFVYQHSVPEDIQKTVADDIAELLSQSSQPNALNP